MLMRLQILAMVLGGVVALAASLCDAKVLVTELLPVWHGESSFTPQIADMPSGDKQSSRVESSRAAPVAIESNPLRTSSLGSLPLKTYTTTELILHPDVVYKNFGITPSPVCVTSAKVTFNCGVQVALLLGTDVFRGRDVMQKKLEGHVRLGVSSMLFQLAAQVSAVSTYVMLADATRCMESLERWNDYAFLISQHSSTAGLVVGIANLALIRNFIDPNEKSALLGSNILLYTGLVSGLPVWASLATVLISPGGVVILLYLWWRLQLTTSDGDSQLDLEFLKVGYFVPLIALVWCAIGAYAQPWHSFMLLGAVMLEFVVPICAVVGSWRLILGPMRNKTVARAIMLSFVFGMSASFLLSMGVPTCLLTRDGYFASAAPEAFWSKKVAVYVNYTFTMPVHHDLGQATSASTVVRLWWSEIVALFS